MTKKLNSMPDYQARMPRQPHDTSRAITYTAAPSMLLPTYYDMLHLGDEIFFSATQFSRLNPLVTASLVDIDIHIDYFFIPLSVMYTPAPSLFYHTDDLISSNFAKDNPEFQSHFPRYALDASLFQQLYYNNGSIASYETPFAVIGNTFTHLPTTGFDCRGRSYHRILDMFGYYAESVFLRSSGVDPTAAPENPISTPWFLAAYQCVYQKYFRNDDREPLNYHYNMDKYYDVANFMEANRNNKPLYALNYRSYYKDYFMAAKVSPLGSSVSLILNPQSTYPINIFNDVRNYIDNGSNLVSQPGRLATNILNNSSTQVIQFITETSNTPRISTGQIRSMFAFEKLIRVIGRAEKNYESQFLAHFGVKIPHDVMHNITHIGHDMATLRPEPVISKADTFNGDTGSALGEVGGQGQIKFTGRQRSFKAPCHGVFLVITSHQPRFRYKHGLDKLHDLDQPMKFWQPEYDKLGMQPLYKYEAYADIFATNPTERVGWQFRYEEFKRKYSTVTAAFVNPEPRFNNVNTYSPWVLSRSAFNFWNQQLYNSPLSNPYAFIGSPNDLNSIMVVPHETTWSVSFDFASPWLLYQTDPFICDFNLSCKKVNFMSEFGEPEL